MSEPESPYLDHLAVGVATWADGFAQLAGQFGGRWSHGGDAGEFAPGQLEYQDGMRLEVISPGSTGDGFMRRFLDRGGPGPHHITFRVPSLDASLERVSALGIPSLPGRIRVPGRQEAFLHPKVAGLGTLLQLVEESRVPHSEMPPPDGFPAVVPPPLRIAWIGISTESLSASEELFAKTLAGEVVDAGDGWRLFGWGIARRLLVRTGPATPGGAELWPAATGVAHVVFGPADLRPEDGGLQPNPIDPRVGLATWSSRLAF